ncbi:MAG TPA: ABC transporter substrate-binding protein [Stellaceae bacterium]|jgi:branched-chain amino acid transport system substrate-binding protein|nr:ABC transporter substrate-binding protein [Stellaceae bacterium]
MFRSISIVGAIALTSAGAAFAENAPGVTATEIKIGQTMPYSGPVSPYAVIGKVEAAYFTMINDQGGVNGRKIVFDSVDDGFNPGKTVELTRKLIEQDKAAFIFGSLGTPTGIAVRGYLNSHHIPQLFLATGANALGDPAKFPWTMHFNPSYRTEAQVYAKYILKEKPTGKLAILYEDDDQGRDYLRGIKDVFGDKYDRMVAAVSYETSDPTVDTQVITLQGSGAQIFFIGATARWSAQAIKKSSEIGWKALRIVDLNSTSIAGTLKPAGLENSIGLITAAAYKDQTSPQWKDDADLAVWNKFLDKYMPSADRKDGGVLYGYSVAQTMVQVLKQCGNDLSRDNIMKQAANLHHFHAAALLPGIDINTSPTNYHPIRGLVLGRFDGKSWVNFSDVIVGN